MRSISSLILATALLGGCASPTSPLTSRTASERLSTGQVVAVGAGGMLGAFAGQKLAGNTGALLGGATGLVAGSLVHNAVISSADQQRLEAVEQARREERLRIMREYWRDRTETEKPAARRAAFPPTPLLPYPAGIYDGINFAPRLATDATLSEPIR